MNFLQIFYSFAVAVDTATKKLSKKAAKKLTREDEERWKTLLIASSTGDSLSYETLLGEMAEYLKYFCSRYLYQESQTEDCVQECLLAIHKAKHTFNPSKPIGPWFFTIVRHKIIDQFRKNKRLNEREVQDPDIVDSLQSTSSEVDFAKELANLLTGISAKYATAFKLCRLEGKTIQEAAKELNIGESAVKLRVHRASTAIKKLIKEEFSKRYE